jgi:hypothetical protein
LADAGRYILPRLLVIDDDDDDDDNKHVWPTWAVGVLSGVRDVETYNRGHPSHRMFPESHRMFPESHRTFPESHLLSKHTTGDARLEVFQGVSELPIIDKL